MLPVMACWAGILPFQTLVGLHNDVPPMLPTSTLQVSVRLAEASACVPLPHITSHSDQCFSIVHTAGDSA
jgi:hypothetical protein